MSFIETSTPDQLLEMARMMAENRKAIRSHQQDLQLGRERSEADREKQAAPVVKGILGAPTKEGAPATGLEKLVERMEDVDRSTQEGTRTTRKQLKKLVHAVRGDDAEELPTTEVPALDIDSVTEDWVVDGSMDNYFAAFEGNREKKQQLVRIRDKLGFTSEQVPTSGRGRNVETVIRLLKAAISGRRLAPPVLPGPLDRGDTPFEADFPDAEDPGTADDPEEFGPGDLFDIPPLEADDAAGVFPRTADEQLDELMRGNGIPKFRPRMPYTADPATGQFGRLRIDLPRLVAVGRTPKLVAFDAAGKQVLSVKADDTLVRLVLNRFDEKTPYTPAAIAAFRALVRKANLPVAKHSNKWKRFLQADEEQVGAGVRYYRTPEAMLARTQLLLGERAAGNQAPEVARELFDCLEELLRTGVITKANYVAIRRKYLA